MRNFILAGVLLPGMLLAQQISNIDVTLATRFAGTAVSDLAGASVYLQGDYNGDGIADVAIGAPNADGDVFANVGKVYVIYGRPGAAPDLRTLDTIAPEDGFVIEGHAPNIFLGETLVAADLNGDGIDDLIAAAPRAPDFAFSLSGPNLGILSVTFGSRAPIASSTIDAYVQATDREAAAGLVLEGGFLNGRAGASIARGGDINGDGVEDLLVGSDASDFNAGGVVRPTAYLLFGRSGSSAWPGLFKLVNLRPAFSDGSDGTIIQGDGIEDVTGRAIIGLGDINGDGLNDFAVGAPGASIDDNLEGAVYLLAGKPLYPAGIDLNNLEPDGIISRIVGRAEQRIGDRLTVPGDMNGDGRRDLAIGAPVSDEFNGSIDVLYAPEQWPREIRLADDFPGFRLRGANAGRFGEALAPAGDLNGDGLADLLVGARDHPSGGRSWVIHGQSGRPADGAVDSAPGVGFIDAERSADSHGRGVSGSGDLDADGSNDLIVGAPLNDTGAENGGVAYFFSGRGEDGAPAMRGPLSHAWFDPSAPGQGVLVEYGLRDGAPALFAAWYTFDNGEPLWLVTDLVNLPTAGRSVSTDLFVTEGADFGPLFDPAAVTSRRFGEVRITQTSCGSLLWEYERADGNSGSLVFVPVLADQLGLDTCTIGGSNPESDALRARETGTWWNPDRAGEGIIFETEGRNNPARFFFSWFTYLGGRQLWLVGSATLDASGQPGSFDLFSASGARFGSAFDPDDVRLDNRGSATLTFAACGAATLEFALNEPGGTLAGEIDLVRFTGGLSELPCTATR